MTIRAKAAISHIIAFAGFLGLMTAWVVQGGDSGPNTLFLAAFGWMTLVTVWQYIALRCPDCRRQIWSEQDLPWPTPVQCTNCGHAL